MGNSKPASDLLLQVVDVGIGAIIFCTPLIFGGRHPIGQLALVALCGLVGVAWFARQALVAGDWTRTSAIWVLLLAIGMVAFQIVPLPSSWTAALSPRTQGLLPLSASEAAAGETSGTLDSLSVAPAETRRSIALLFGYGLLFVTASQRLQSREDIERVLKWIGFSVLIGAVFGVLQYLTSNGKYFWFYEYPHVNTDNEVIGSFTNRNHFAHFLVLGIGPLVAYFSGRAFTDQQRQGSPGMSRQMLISLALLGIAGSTVLWAALLTFSRGGAMALCITLLVLSTVYVRFRIIKWSDLGMLLALGLFVVVGGLSIYGFDRVSARLDDFTSGSLDELDPEGGRRKIWSANLAAIQDGWQAGSGAGTHRYVYQAYLFEPDNRVFTHAENSYLQVVTENGLPGALLIAMAICCCISWIWVALSGHSNKRTAVCAGGISAALVASLVHALVDFVWFVPACMAITVLIAACALRLGQLGVRSEKSSTAATTLRRPIWVGLCLTAAVGVVLAISELLGPAQAAVHWHRFELASILHKSVRGQQFSKSGMNQNVKLHDHQLTRHMVQELQQVVRSDPSHARAHNKLALQLLRLFEIEMSEAQNRMTISQIRDAAFASQFSNSQELKEWLTRAFGQPSELLYQALHHNRRAIELAPLQGRAYVLLAQLCFLEGRGEDYVQQCLAQALKVTPFDNDVLFAAGIHTLARGDVEAAIGHWHHLFRSPTTHQYQIVSLLAGKIPAEMLLESLRPGPLSLPYVWRRYQQLGSDADWAVIGSYVANQAADASASLDSDEEVGLWRLLAAIQRHMDRPQDAVVSLQRALRILPNDYSTRYELGEVAMQLGEFELSDEQFRWCLSRQPEHEGLKKRLAEVGRLRLRVSHKQELGTHARSL